MRGVGGQLRDAVSEAAVAAALPRPPVLLPTPDPAGLTAREQLWSEPRSVAPAF